MQITFKLYASLTDHLPPEHRRGNQMPLEVAPEATIASIIAPFQLPMKMVHLVLINGVYVAPRTAPRAPWWTATCWRSGRPSPAAEPLPMFPKDVARAVQPGARLHPGRLAA